MDSVIYAELKAIRAENAELKGQILKFATDEAIRADQLLFAARSEEAALHALGQSAGEGSVAIWASFPWGVFFRNPLLAMLLMVLGELVGRKWVRWFLAASAVLMDPVTTLICFIARAVVRRTVLGSRIFGPFCCGSNTFAPIKDWIFSDSEPEATVTVSQSTWRWYNPFSWGFRTVPDPADIAMSA